MRSACVYILIVADPAGRNLFLVKKIIITQNYSPLAVAEILYIAAPLSLKKNTRPRSN